MTGALRVRKEVQPTIVLNIASQWRRSVFPEIATGSNSIMRYVAVAAGATARKVSTAKRARSTHTPAGRSKNASGW